jgi:DDE superfamily endonuclease
MIESMRWGLKLLLALAGKKSIPGRKPFVIGNFVVGNSFDSVKERKDLQSPGAAGPFPARPCRGRCMLGGEHPGIPPIKTDAGRLYPVAPIFLIATRNIAVHHGIRLDIGIDTSRQCCVDEKTAIQALDRLDPVLPLSPGRAERHGFEYHRHGTLSLYAALNVKTGRVEGKTAKRHASADLIAFLTELIGKTKWAREIHIVLDNLSAHKTQAVQDFLSQNPKVCFHFTPTYSSWLNQVEI